LNADLEALIRLQKTRDRIATLTTRIETEIPAHIAELETELRGVRERVDAGHVAIETARRERARLELDLKAADEKINKYKAALMQVKTNDEYRAALNEIDYTNRTRSELETRVLELMEEVDSRREELKALEEELRVEDEKIHTDRKMLEEEREALGGKRSSELTTASEIENRLPARLVGIYQRIAAVRGGVVLALARDGVCVACNMRLRPSIFQQVKRNEQVITCDSCGRILYYEEPPAPVEPPSASVATPVPPAQSPRPSTPARSARATSSPARATPAPGQGE
jgi:predicted  nucleic acid-binding Zn-ribbon protein